MTVCTIQSSVNLYGTYDNHEKTNEFLHTLAHDINEYGLHVKEGAYLASVVVNEDRDVSVIGEFECESIDEVNYWLEETLLSCSMFCMVGFTGDFWAEEVSNNGTT